VCNTVKISFMFVNLDEKCGTDCWSVCLSSMHVLISDMFSGFCFPFSLPIGFAVLKGARIKLENKPVSRSGSSAQTTPYSPF